MILKIWFEYILKNNFIIETSARCLGCINHPPLFFNTSVCVSVCVQVCAYAVLLKKWTKGVNSNGF